MNCDLVPLIFIEFKWAKAAKAHKSMLEALTFDESSRADEPGIYQYNH